jgi:glycosyltransferase involved in cell wall biosynthesis
MVNIDVLFLTKYDQKGASSRYRSLQYFPYLENAGINCTHAPLLSDEYLEVLYETESRPLLKSAQGYLGRLQALLQIRTYDVIVIEKELLPYAPAIFERLLSHLRTPYIVDYDDAVFHNYDLSDNPIVRRLLSSKIDVVMHGADAVVAGNEYLASRARDAGASRVEIIPTVIDLNRYKYVPPSGEEPFTIGWIGSPTTVKYVKNIIPALQKISEDQEIKIVLVGSGSVEAPGVLVETQEWSEETEIEYITSFDVGIMPLENSPWERGKCGIKLIQYMGCGKPVVASPVGMNTEIITHDRNGLFAKSNDEWAESLLRLNDNQKLAKEMGREGRKLVVSQYSLQSAKYRWIKLLTEIHSDIV